MTFIAYEDWNPRPEAAMQVGVANQIINEFQKQGYVLTLRQLYYQFVARDLIPNTERSYKNLGRVIDRARKAGLLSWTAIEDRNREHHEFWTEEDPLTVVRDMPRMIRFDQWARQPCYVEVWVEKEALGNVISKACKPYMVPYMSCKGYMSSSEVWRAGQRFAEQVEDGKECHLIHLGDHDPSGMDMTRDNQRRLRMFAHTHDITINRIALNMDQIEEYKPPRNPAKFSDSRAAGYVSRYGRSSWELDALKPQVLNELITETIRELINFDIWDETEREEQDVEELLSGVADKWELVERLVKGDLYYEE